MQEENRVRRATTELELEGPTLSLVAVAVQQKTSRAILAIRLVGIVIALFGVGFGFSSMAQEPIATLDTGAGAALQIPLDSLTIPGGLVTLGALLSRWKPIVRHEVVFSFDTTSRNFIRRLVRQGSGPLRADDDDEPADPNP